MKSCMKDFISEQIYILHAMVKCPKITYTYQEWTACVFTKIHSFLIKFFLITNHENKILQLMSAGASLERFGESYRPCFHKMKIVKKHFFKNEWTLCVSSYCAINNEPSTLLSWFTMRQKAFWSWNFHQFLNPQFSKIF